MLTATGLCKNGAITLNGNGSGAAATVATSGSVANNGTITLNNDIQTFAGAVSGVGTFLLTNNSTLELDGTVAAMLTVSFVNNDTLKLGNAKSFSASISSFNVGDFLDLTSYASGSSLSFAENAAGTAGVLTVGTGAGAI